MNTDSVTQPDPPPGGCPRCGAAIPSEAPGGLCPRCVLLGAATPSESGTHTRLGEPPPLEVVRAAFPQLEITELFGRGGMGFVYRARQPHLDRTVALKLLPLPAGTDPAFAERFAREGRLLARLSHPNIVAVYEFGQAAGFAFLLLEFVDGVNLRQAMQAGRFSPHEALAIVPKICEALQFAHDHGVLHRDIKPENILLDAAGRVKIADFGIAKLVGDRSDERSGEITLTASGARLGTPHYMAPEQVEKPSEVDHRADIYSLGVVFYELLTGELPLGRFAAPSTKADLDARVDAIVMRALAKERELRQQSAREVRTEVEGLGTPDGEVPPPAPPISLPSWARQVAWLCLIYVGLNLAGSALALGLSGWNSRVFIVPMGILLVPVSVALWSRRPYWRLAGLAGSGFLFFGQVIGTVYSIVWATTHSPGSFSFPVFSAPLLTPVIMLLSALGIVIAGAGFGTLQHPDVRHAFGLPRVRTLHSIPNPWPHRLFWLMMAGFALLASAVVAALLSPALSRVNGGLGGITAGIIPFTVGALLVWLFVTTRPTAAQATPRDQWNPWPKRVFMAVITLIVLPLTLLVAGLVLPYIAMRQVAFRPAPLQAPFPPPLVGDGAPSPAAVAGPNLQFRPTERIVSDSQVRLRWELRSPQPASVRLSLGRQSTEFPLSQRGVGDFRETVTVQFEAQNDGGAAVQLTVMLGDVTEGRLFNVAMAGDPQELLAKATELVAGDLVLTLNTPVWIAFFGDNQVVLEVIPQTPTTRPTPPQ